MAIVWRDGWISLICETASLASFPLLTRTDPESFPVLCFVLLLWKVLLVQGTYFILLRRIEQWNNAGAIIFETLRGDTSPPSDSNICLALLLSFLDVSQVACHLEN